MADVHHATYNSQAIPVADMLASRILLHYGTLHYAVTLCLYDFTAEDIIVREVGKSIQVTSPLFFTLSYKTVTLR
jgi:hypothetical protein